MSNQMNTILVEIPSLSHRCIRVALPQFQQNPEYLEDYRIKNLLVHFVQNLVVRLDHQRQILYEIIPEATTNLNRYFERLSILSESESGSDDVFTLHYQNQVYRYSYSQLVVTWKVVDTIVEVCDALAIFKLHDYEKFIYLPQFLQLLDFKASLLLPSCNTTAAEQDAGTTEERVSFHISSFSISSIPYLIKYSQTFSAGLGVWRYNYLFTNLKAKGEIVEILWLLNEPHSEEHHPSNESRSFRITTAEKSSAELIKLLFPSTMEDYNSQYDLVVPRNPSMEIDVKAKAKDEECRYLECIPRLFEREVEELEDVVYAFASVRKLSDKVQKEVTKLKELIYMMNDIRHSLASFQLSNWDWAKEYDVDTIFHSFRSFCEDAKKCFLTSIQLWYEYGGSRITKKKERNALKKTCRLWKGTGLQQLDNAQHAETSLEYLQKSADLIAAYNGLVAEANKLEMKSFDRRFPMGYKAKGRISDRKIEEARIGCCLAIARRPELRERYQLVMDVLSLMKDFPYPESAPVKENFASEMHYEAHFELNYPRNRLDELARDVCDRAGIYFAFDRKEAFKIFQYLNQFIKDHIVGRAEYWTSDPLVFDLILDYLNKFSLFTCREDTGNYEFQYNIVENVFRTLLWLRSSEPLDEEPVYQPQLSLIFTKQDVYNVFTQCINSLSFSHIPHLLPLDGIIQKLEKDSTNVAKMKSSCALLLLFSAQFSVWSDLQKQPNTFILKTFLFCRNLYDQLKGKTSMEENEVTSLLTMFYMLNCELYLDPTLVVPRTGKPFDRLKANAHLQRFEPVPRSLTLQLSNDCFFKSMSHDNLQFRVLLFEIGKFLFHHSYSFCEPFHSTLQFAVQSFSKLREFDVLFKMITKHDQYEKKNVPPWVFRESLKKWSEELLLHAKNFSTIPASTNDTTLESKMNVLLENLFVLEESETFSKEKQAVLESNLSAITFYLLGNYQLSELYYELALSIPRVKLHASFQECVDLLQRGIESIIVKKDFEEAKRFREQAKSARKDAMKI
jgi:hypothetical protein